MAESDVHVAAGGICTYAATNGFPRSFLEQVTYLGFRGVEVGSGVQQEVLGTISMASLLVRLFCSILHGAGNS